MTRLLRAFATDSGTTLSPKETRRRKMVYEVGKVRERLEAKTVREVEEQMRLQEAKAAEMRTRAQANEKGGPTGSEPTRFGDWERKGRCSDF